MKVQQLAGHWLLQCCIVVVDDDDDSDMKPDEISSLGTFFVDCLVGPTETVARHDDVPVSTAQQYFVDLNGG